MTMEIFILRAILGLTALAIGIGALALTVGRP
jgi:hypothetical protein